MSGYRKGQANIHAAGVVLDRGIEKFLDFGKCGNLVKFPGDFGPPHAKDRPVKINILAAAKLGMKAGPHLQQCSDAPIYFSLSDCRIRNPREYFQECALSRAIATDYSEDLTLLDVE